MAAPASEETLEQLRIRHQVRPLRPEEEGLTVGRLPAGVYGYAYAPGLAETPLFAQKTYHAFEVHKAADGTESIIGFVTLDEAAELEARKEGTSIRLFPDAREQSQRLVSVNVSAIVPPKRMPREEGNPFPFTIA